MTTCPYLASGEPSGKARARSSRARSRRAGNPGGPEGDALDGAGSPRLVLVREPDQLGVERAHPQLAFGVRLVGLPEQTPPAPADDARPPANLDDDHLHAGCVPRRRDEPEPRKQLELAVDRHVAHAGRFDPLANGVVVLAARVVELPTLDGD